MKKKLYCVYVAIGQNVRLCSNRFRGWGIKIYNYCYATASVLLHYNFELIQAAIGEYFRDNGMHALIVYDDLSKQAVA